MFCKKSVLKVFTKFTRLKAFSKKETLAQVFPVNFAKFLRTPFLTEHLRWLLLKTWINSINIILIFYFIRKSRYHCRGTNVELLLPRNSNNLTHLSVKVLDLFLSLMTLCYKEKIKTVKKKKMLVRFVNSRN